ncbi:MAG TPA: hypothetical protein VGP06_02280 [Janthinobacterium sp.]|jgi:hemerythrin-like domain-containing protein|nr:hypothetical protein [Janthinobacterium sp.]
MLTATYALLTLTVEQKKERNFITRLLQHVRAVSNKPQAIDAALIASQVYELTQFAEVRHQRKVETCLMPALRHACVDAAPMLADMQSLSSLGGAMLCSVRKRLRRVASGVRQVKHLCRALDQYCQNLLARLEMEERQLLPLAQRVMSNEAWFKLGSMFLDHEAKRNEDKRSAGRIK